MKIALSEKATNRAERVFFQAIEKKLNENPRIDFEDALKLVASENPDLQRDYVKSRAKRHD